MKDSNSIFNSRARQKGKVVEKETFNSDELDEIAADIGRVRAVLETIEYICDNTPPCYIEKIEALASISARTAKSVNNRISEISLIQFRAEKSVAQQC